MTYSIFGLLNFFAAFSFVPINMGNFQLNRKLLIYGILLLTSFSSLCVFQAFFVNNKKYNVLNQAAVKIQIFTFVANFVINLLWSWYQFKNISVIFTTLKLVDKKLMEWKDDLQKENKKVFVLGTVLILAATILLICFTILQGLEFNNVKFLIIYIAIVFELYKVCEIVIVMTYFGSRVAILKESWLNSNAIEVAEATKIFIKSFKEDINNFEEHVFLYENLNFLFQLLNTVYGVPIFNILCVACFAITVQIYYYLFFKITTMQVFLVMFWISLQMVQILTIVLIINYVQKKVS